MKTRLRTWLTERPELFDRVRPLVRVFREEPAINRELRKHLGPLRHAKALQIGAHDGMTHDPFREYLIQTGWESVVVEPNPLVFKKLERNYRSYPNVRPVNAAAGYDQPTLTLWGFDEEFLATRPDAAGLSTLVSFSRDNMLRFITPGDDAVNHIRQFTVPCRTLEGLAEQAGWKSLDAVFVDVEGFENNVLLKADFARLNPRIVVFEHHLLPDKGAAIKARLATHGFTVTEVESDSIAIRQ